MSNCSFRKTETLCRTLFADTKDTRYYNIGDIDKQRKENFRD